MYTCTTAGLIESHDFIFWCGDFNYRLELDKNTAESSIKRSDWMVSTPLLP